MRCSTCGGTTRPGRVTFAFTEEPVVIVRDVPADVCTQCHEEYYDADVSERLLALAKRVTDTEVAVLRYTAA